MWPWRQGGEGWGGDDDDDIQFMVIVVPVIRIDFPYFLSRLTRKTETDRC